MGSSSTKMHLKFLPFKARSDAGQARAGTLQRLVVIFRHEGFGGVRGLEDSIRCEHTLNERLTHHMTDCLFYC